MSIEQVQINQQLSMIIILENKVTLVMCSFYLIPKRSCLFFLHTFIPPKTMKNFQNESRFVLIFESQEIKLASKSYFQIKYKHIDFIALLW